MPNMPPSETIRKRVDDSEKMLTEKGFTILWDVNDEEWKDTFTVTGAVCVAVGTKKQILELWPRRDKKRTTTTSVSIFSFF